MMPARAALADRPLWMREVSRRSAADPCERIERGHRLLEDHGDAIAAHARAAARSPAVSMSSPSIFRILRRSDGEARRVGQELAATDKRGDRLAGAGLARRARASRRDARSNDTRSTAVNLPARPISNCHRSLTRRQSLIGAHLNVFRGSKASRTASPMKISSDSMMPSVKNAVRPSQGALRFPLPWASNSPQRRRARRQAEAQKVERGQRHDRARQDEGHEGQRGHHRVGQNVAEHHARVRSTPSAFAART
jgi:hypothetical protein